MPPKSTTRGRGRGRGRGGTARGAASAAAVQDAVQTSEAAESSAATASNVNSADTATVPETVVPSESAPDIAVSSTSSGLPTTSTTPAPASSSRGSAVAKFKPKGVRRSEAERARIAEEQSRIQEQRNAEETRRLARLNRGQGRGRGRGRGRGGFLRGNLRTSAAAGPLAAGMSFGGGGPSGGAGGYAYASGSGSGSDFVKGEGDGKGDRSAYGASGIIVDSRIDADRLYHYVEVSDEEDRASITSTKTKKKPIMPMGIRRVEHKEEGVTMTTAAEIEAQEKAGAVDEESDEEGLFVGGPTVEDTEEPIRDDSVWEVAQARRIKQEEVAAGAMDLDEIPEGFKAPESPELRKRVPVPEQRPQKKSAAPRDPEDDIIAEDLQRMLELFTMQGDDAPAEDGTAHNAALEGHMFLLQFPRVLPPLRAVARDGTLTNPISVKPEPDDDVVMLNQPPINIDLTQDSDNKVKKEGDGEEEEDGQSEEEGDELKEGGFLGNLTVRKSGKVELSWGGYKLELGMGVQANFLSTAVLMEQSDVKPGDATQMAGAAYGMGKIQGSFSLAPMWGEEEEWVVDPKDLELPRE